MSNEAPLEPRPAGTPARSAIAFAIFGALAALIVGNTWQWTREPIADSRARHTIAELGRVLPPELHDNSPHEDVIWRDTGGGAPVPVYRARLGGVPSAVVLTAVAPDGYTGEIRMLVAVDADGRVLGVRVTEHRETPGIGDAVTRRGWLSGLAGRSATDPPPEGWRLRRNDGEFDSITGATLSSRAVVTAVGRAVQYFDGHRAEIFGAEAEKPPVDARGMKDGK